MKIAVTAIGNNLDSPMDPRFGRAAWFIFIDTETMAYEACDNVSAAASGGAGIASGQMVADKDAQALITGNVGPNAMNVLKAAGVEIYKGLAVTVRENVGLLKKGQLEKITSTVASHFGMGGV